VSIEKLIEKDYYLPTKIIGFLSRKTRKILGITDSSYGLAIRFSTSFLFFGFLAYGIPILVGIITGDYLFDSIEIILAFLWFSVAGLLIDCFEYAVDDFWIEYKKISKLKDKEFKNLKEFYNKKIFSKKYLIFSVVIYLVMIPVVFESLQGHSLTLIIIVHLQMVMAAILWGIVIYLTFYMYYLIKKLSNFPININPLNHDGFGGLNILAKLPLRVASLISTGSLYLPYAINRLYTISTETPTKSVILLGVLLVPGVIILTFFIPLIPVNKIAKKTKHEMLDKLGLQINGDIETYCKKIDVNYCIDNLLKIQQYKQIKEMKTMPISPHVFFELIAFILLPTFLFFIGMELQNI